MNPAARVENSSLLVSQYLLGGVLLLAPLFYSGQLALATLVLELLCLAAVIALCWMGSPFSLGKLGVFEWTFLALLLAIPLFQILPLPGLSRVDLAGQADYHVIQKLMKGGELEGAVTLSLVPWETLRGWLLLLIPVGVYVVGRHLDTSALRTLMSLLLAVATFEAIVGLAQFGTGPGSAWYFGMDTVVSGQGSAVGTYTSRNNYVGFMYLALMAATAMFMATLGRYRNKAGKQSLRQRLVYFSTPQGHRAFVFGALSLLFLLAIIFSRSRMGIGVTICGILLASAAFSRRIGGNNVYGLTGTIVSLVAAAAIAIGLAPVLDRFGQDTLSDGRWDIWAGTWDGIANFWPLGSGSGTFMESFYRFESLAAAGAVTNRAHNSYLEWLYTAGLPALLLMILFAVLYLRRWLQLWKAGEWGEFRYLQVGCGIGLFLMILHDMVDYNLVVPANMAYFAFFAAVFFHDYQEPVKKRRSDIAKDALMERRRVGGAQLQVVESPPEGNPFMDDFEEAAADKPGKDDWPTQ